MRFHSLDIPPKSKELAGWLTDQILSLHFDEFVAEMAAIHAGNNAEDRSLDDILGDHTQAVLVKGLSELPHEQLVELLTRPLQLLDLQKLVFAKGGACWDPPGSVAKSLEPQVESDWLSLRRSIDEEQWRVFSTTQFPQTTAERNRLLHPVVVSLFTAVLLVAAYFIAQHFNVVGNSNTTGEWGWNRPEVFTEPASREEYLIRLAEATEEWSAAKPFTTTEVAARIRYFRIGVRALQKAEHSQLSAADREWLISSGSELEISLDENLDILSDEGGAYAVRSAIDKKVADFADSLRDRAKSPPEK